MHDLLYERQAQLSDSFYSAAAAAVDVSLSRFNSCIGDEGKRAVENDIELAKGLQIVSTPMFFIGIVTDTGDVRVTSTLRGSQDIETFRKVLDTALKAQAYAR
jgi:protein-disulfide isomerase